METISDLMMREFCTVFPDDTLSCVRRAMREGGAGTLVVCENRHLLGINTDGDIVAQDSSAPASLHEQHAADIMSAPGACCFDDLPLSEAAERIGCTLVGAISVLNHAMELVEVVSVNDMLPHRKKERSACCRSVFCDALPHMSPFFGPHSRF
jgi:CBS-domain-containing membrane protein